MLLSCCFQDPKNKKHKKKKDKKKNIKLENEASPSASACLLTTPSHSPLLTVHSATLRASQGHDTKLSQEKHPPSKEEKRLLKQRSPESLHHRSVISENCPSQRSSIIITNKSNTDHLTSPNFSHISSIHDRKESLPSPPATPKYIGECGKRCSITEGSSLSASDLLETSTPCKNSSVSRSDCYNHGSDLILTSTPLGAYDAVSCSTTSIAHSTSSIATIKQNNQEDDTDLNDTELHDEQVRKEHESGKRQTEQKLIDKTRGEYELILQNLKEENQLEFEKATETWKQKFHRELLKHEKENEEAISKAKSEASETISKLNQQIVLERGKMISEQQQNAKNLEEEFRMKGTRLNESFKEIEVRDQAWQEERADVLKEIQRLKAEALQMVKILAMEYEEENLSEDKKKRLGQEVYSLQLVVEMRTGEMKNLREQLARVTQELDQAEIVKEKLGKATAKMEVLQEQLRIKAKVEKQLSVEKTQMEQEMMVTNKAAQRMSQNVEELQWRIRNNFDLPVEVFTSPASQQSSFRGFCAPLKMSLNNSEGDQILQSTPLPGIQSECQSQKKSFFAVTPEMLKATSTDQKIMEIFDDQCITSEFYPSSDGLTEKFAEEEAERQCIRDEDNIDGDSLDEGLGDISSDESAESPVPNIENLNNHKNINNIECVQPIMICAKGSEKNIPQNLESDETQLSSLLKCEQERRPSRIALETPL